MDKLGSSTKQPSRRDYFIGCALKALIQSKPMETDDDRVISEAIQYGTKVDAKLAEMEAPAEPPK